MSDPAMIDSDFVQSDKMKIQWKGADYKTPNLGLASKREIRAIRELTDSEFKDYEGAESKLRQYVDDQQLFAIVQLNYVDFEDLLRQSFQQYVKKSLPPMEVLALRVNRSLLNFLSTLRTFLDHSEFNLKKRYGNYSKRVREYKKACSSEYDNFFSYRLVYKLRNYTQHCGMPLGQIRFESKSEDAEAQRVVDTLAVYFNRDRLLLSEFDWGSKLKREIQALPERFEINPHVAQAMQCVKRINLSLIKPNLTELNRSVQIVRSLVAPLKLQSGVPCILFFGKGSIKGGNSLKVTIHRIPLHLLDLIPDTQ